MKRIIPFSAIILLLICAVIAPQASNAKTATTDVKTTALIAASPTGHICTAEAPPLIQNATITASVHQAVTKTNANIVTGTYISPQKTTTTALTNTGGSVKNNTGYNNTAHKTATICAGKLDDLVAANATYTKALPGYTDTITANKASTGWDVSATGWNYPILI